jgi:rhomboid protease GluP
MNSPESHTVSSEPEPDAAMTEPVSGQGMAPAVVTWFLIAVNVAVFAAMVLTGVSPVDPVVPEVLKWGADFAPNTLTGEWWRLLTCMFIHFGIAHIVLNLWVLAGVGPLVERMAGHGSFLLLYIFSGLSGSLISLFWNPLLVSAGASGAIFGVYGILLALLLRQHSTQHLQSLSALRNRSLGFLLYNLAYGMFQENIDSAAHIGGLAGGFVGGIIFRLLCRNTQNQPRLIQQILFCLIAVPLIVSGAIFVAQHHQHLIAAHNELETFATVEEQALKRFNEAVEKAKSDQMTDSAFASVIDNDVLPEWNSTRQRLETLTPHVSALQQRVVHLVTYMTLRQESWTQLSQGLRAGDRQKIQQSQESAKKAEDAMQQLLE